MQHILNIPPHPHIHSSRLLIKDKAEGRDWEENLNSATFSSVLHEIYFIFRSLSLELSGIVNSNDALSFALRQASTS